MLIILTNSHAFDPVVKVAKVEYATLSAFTESNFLPFIVVLGDSTGEILS